MTPDEGQGLEEIREVPPTSTFFTPPIILPGISIVHIRRQRKRTDSLRLQYDIYNYVRPPIGGLKM